MEPQVIEYSIPSALNDEDELNFTLELRTTALGETAWVTIEMGDWDWDIPLSDFLNVARRFETNAKRRKNRILQGIENLG